jgi:hypothetical protein
MDEMSRNESEMSIENIFEHKEMTKVFQCHILNRYSVDEFFKLRCSWMMLALFVNKKKNE